MSAKISRAWACAGPSAAAARAARGRPGERAAARRPGPELSAGARAEAEGLGEAGGGLGPGRAGGEPAPGPVQPSGRARVVPGPGQMVGVAQGCLIGGQAHEAARDGRGGERLALAERAKPGGLGAHDLVEGEERRAGRERRLRAGPASSP